ncbi:MAG: L,D-transpeptidase family protein [Gammaproteobacteria bacterium]|nr:L,D-transpeptidase family protein [Gammaproteobacteria bacterium]
MHERARRCAGCFVGLLFIHFLWSPAYADHTISDALRLRLESAVSSQVDNVKGVGTSYPGELLTFYEERQFVPVWVDNSGSKPLVVDFIEALRNSAAHGLNPTVYLPDSSGLVDGATSRNLTILQLANLELLLSDRFLQWSSDLLRGRVRPEKLYDQWQATPRERDLVDVLRKAVAGTSFFETAAMLVPQHIGYRRLVDALARYRLIQSAGGFMHVPSDSTLRYGDSNPQVVVLAQRLIETGDLAISPDKLGPQFDDGLQQAVMRFQARHGLDADGIVGPATFTALNTSIDDRIRQIVVNLERWRWLPQELGSRYLVVNIAGFYLDVIENEASVLNMRVIVGKRYTKTPIFSETMTYLVVNPYWNVPASIAVKEILPKQRADPKYLESQNMRVFSGWGDTSSAVDPSTVNWAEVSPSRFPYRFRQEPGSGNALGRVKFMFPNRYNVYLHDTPTHSLFARSVRDFSHGCIRLERPLDLAAYLLRDNLEWTPSRVQTATQDRTESTIILKQAIPVHILYWTTWVDPDGTINFRDDIYNRDLRLSEALDSKIN